MPKVYVIQDPDGKNILSASDFGEIVILLPADRQVTFSPGPTIFELRQKLAYFTDQDFLLFIGDPAAIAMASAIVTDQNGGRFKILKWDRQEHRYYPIQIELYPDKKH
jgi:hypothetical protein